MILSDGGRSKELGQVTCGFTLWSLMDKSDHPPLEPWLQSPHGSLPLSPPANPPHPLHGDLSVFIPDTVVSGHEIPPAKPGHMTHAQVLAWCMCSRV